MQGELAATKGELEQAQGAVSTLTSLVGQQQEQINGLKAEVGTYKEFAAHVSEAQTTLVLNQSKKRRFSDGGGHGSGGGKQQQQGGASSSGGGSSKQQQGGGGNDGGHKPKPKRPSRPTDVFAYCVKYKMCARCYGHHHSDDCTAEKSAQGKPPGFPKPPAWAKDKDASN